MFRFPLLPLLLIVGLVHSAWGAETPLPPEMVVLRAQPALFFVKTVSDVELTSPQSISANMPLLEGDVPLLRDPPGKKLTTTERYWTFIIDDPAKYLVASPKLVVSNRSNVIIGGGSAFAIHPRSAEYRRAREKQIQCKEVPCRDRSGSAWNERHRRPRQNERGVAGRCSAPHRFTLEGHGSAME